MVGTVTFNHTKGTHLDQQFLPNSLPPGSKAISAGPSGYIYQQTSGNSVFDSVQFALNRRFSSGASGSVSYMWSKAIDSGGVGTLIAQDWTNLNLDRGLSNFDARHTLNAQWQYSSGTGIRGGALMSGWQGRLLKDWTVTNRITLRSGSPLTATAGGNRSVVSGTGVSGPVRANATGIPLLPATPGYGFNLLAFAAPAAGHGVRRAQRDFRSDHLLARRFDRAVVPGRGAEEYQFSFRRDECIEPGDDYQLGHDAELQHVRPAHRGRRHAPDERHLEVHVLMRPIAILLAWVMLAPAQQQQNRPLIPTTGEVKISTSVQLIVVDVTVKDKSGKPMEDLTAKDFTITEDGKPQEIKFFKFQRLEEELMALPAPRGGLSSRSHPWQLRKKNPRRPRFSR